MRAVVSRDRSVFLGTPLPDLLLQIVQLGLLVQRIPHLFLSIELDQQIARMDQFSRAHERRDDERIVVLACKSGCRDRGGFNRFDGATEPKAPNEVATSHFERLRAGV